MKMDEINGTNGVASNEETIEAIKKRRQRDDLVSKKLGELLLQGYRMLNATCENCDCILMQKKNEPTYCVSCQDKDVLLLDQPLKSNKQENSNGPKTNGSSIINDNDTKIQEKNSLTLQRQTQKVNGHNNQISNNPAIDILNSKISWAIDELKSCTNVRYNIELCEMIKSASEAIISLKKLDL